jgi:hypothetical protein
MKSGVPDSWFVSLVSLYAQVRAPDSTRPKEREPNKPKLQAQTTPHPNPFLGEEREWKKEPLTAYGPQLRTSV